MKVGPLLRSAWHTRPGQLAARLRRNFKRRLLDAAGWGSQTRGRGLRDGAPPPIAPDPPPPVFAPRRRALDPEAAAKRAEGDTCLRILGQEFPLAEALPWRPRACTPQDELRRTTLHGMEWLEALPDRAFEAAVRDWTLHNVPCRRGLWRDAWNSFVVAVRCVVWMQQAQARRAALAPETLEAMRRSLAAQIRFLERNLERDLGGNHLVKDLKALLWAGRFFWGADAARWRARGESLLAREIREQVLADGVHFERSPAYHAQVLADLLECRSLLEAGDLREALDRRLDGMAQALADLTHPDGQVSQFNDGGLSMAYSTRECLEAYAAACGRRTRPRKVVALEHAGYYGVRHAGSLFVADCGAIGPDHLPAHGHGDALAFEWSYEGRRVVVDAGVYEYAPGPWRDWSRGTEAHNTVQVGKADQCEFWKAFRVGRRARVRRHRFEVYGEMVILEGSHDGYRHLRGRPVHVRRFIAGPEGVHVEDRVEGGAGQKVRARILLHPDVKVKKRGSTLALVSGASRIVIETPHRVSVVPSWWCPDFYERIPTRQIVIDYGNAPCGGAFRLRAVVSELERSGFVEAGELDGRLVGA